MWQTLLNINTDVLNRLEKIGNPTEKYVYIAQTANAVHGIIIAINTNTIDKETHILKHEFLQIVKAFIKSHGWDDIELSPLIQTSDENVCYNCLNKTEFIVDDDNEFCGECNAIQYFSKTRLTTRDFSRVNIVSRFIYSRLTHFKDCMKQYQGRQNASIPQKVLTDLENKFIAYKLVDPTKESHEKYKKITKAHIIAFLRELKHSKHYENANLIYFKLRGQYFDSIKHLETELIERFKLLLDEYDKIKLNTERKNFMNIQYILFQLLQSLGHPCCLEDFTFLKTSDRKKYHDDICRNIFLKLDWKFTNV